MESPTPQAWLRDTWRTSPLEILVPAAFGLTAAYTLISLFALDSAHLLPMMVCWAAVLLTAWHSVLLLYRLSSDHFQGYTTHVSARDMRELFFPAIASFMLYAAIAPNVWAVGYFAFVSMPYLAALLFLTYRYAEVGASISLGSYIPSIRPFFVKMLPRFKRTPLVRQP